MLKKWINETWPGSNSTRVDSEMAGDICAITGQFHRFLGISEEAGGFSAHQVYVVACDFEGRAFAYAQHRVVAVFP